MVKRLAPSLLGGFIFSIFFFEAGLIASFSSRGSAFSAAAAFVFSLAHVRWRLTLPALGFLNLWLIPALIVLCYPCAGVIFVSIFVFLFISILNLHNKNIAKIKKPEEIQCRSELLTQLGIHHKKITKTNLGLSSFLLTICGIGSTIPLLGSKITSNISPFVKGFPCFVFAVAVLSMVKPMDHNPHKKAHST